MSSPEDSRVNLSLTQENGPGETTTVISGRKCSVLLTKSGPLGLLVKMLLGSPLWWKEGYLLRWEANPLYSRRVTNFTDTNLTSPLPSNASAETLSVSDIPSSRCLFRLRLSEHRTGETGSSSLPLMQTPTVVMTREAPEKMRARAKANGYKNGTRYGSLESQIVYDPRFAELLPTPTAIEGTKGTNTYNPNSQMGSSLSALAGSGMLPTPRANSAMGTALETDFNHEPDRPRNLETVIGKAMLPTPLAVDVRHKKRVEANKKSGVSFKSRENGDARPNGLEDFLDFAGVMDSCQKKDGQSFRLSPLFTEEMMGFPFGWTTFPFLTQSGESNPSRPTETQLSHK